MDSYSKHVFEFNMNFIRYKASKEFATGEPTRAADSNPQVRALRSPNFEQPFAFGQWLDAHRNELNTRAEG